MPNHAQKQGKLTDNLPPQLADDFNRVDAVIGQTEGSREYHIAMQESLRRILVALAKGAQQSEQARQEVESLKKSFEREALQSPEAGGEEQETSPDA